jgi:hypothetical protein
MAPFSDAAAHFIPTPTAKTEVSMSDTLTVVGHPLILHKLTHMRRKDTSTEMFSPPAQRNRATARPTK